MCRRFVTGENNKNALAVNAKAMEVIGKNLLIKLIGNGENVFLFYNT